jgi:hypothetical protein
MTASILEDYLGYWARKLGKKKKNVYTSFGKLVSCSRLELIKIKSSK